MKSRNLYLMAALVIGATSVGAQTPSATTSHDAQCLLISGVLASKPEPAIRNVGMMGSMFFLGKLTGENPNLDLKAVLQREYAAMNPQSIAALQPQCSEELTTRSRQLSTAGDTLVPPTQAQPQK